MVVRQVTLLEVGRRRLGQDATGSRSNVLTQAPQVRSLSCRAMRYRAVVTTSSAFELLLEIGEKKDALIFAPENDE